MHLDALTLNVERACQAAIDLAMHVVAAEHLGIIALIISPVKPLFFVSAPALKSSFIVFG